ncbi:hypothetical protein H634G_09565 [Metarhizium anisopliae BRIP 53293]|uniref:BTB domain-containing protein n=1 Tax=Metarhizium anisopliae BRIP 53293 TaxID=1291518 RepID=A0A0D9NMQ5_METAN|nr:hypothetical protein H634G_09565 [Metarhizium anisopliae BRIP 53293]KJK91576.1 hypothetical protein H633G_04580 [Metarhizium anisopliae BRIP 53284]
MNRKTTEGAASSAGGSSKKWRLPRPLRTKKSKLGKDDKGRTPGSSEFDHIHSSSHLRSDSSSMHTMHEMQENNYRQLQILIQRMRSAPSGPNHVDSAYREFEKIREPCATLCYGILQDELRPAKAMSTTTETTTRRESSLDSPRSPGATIFDQRSSFSGRSLTEVVTGNTSKPGPANELCLNAVRDWKTCLETLCEAFKVSLADTYKSYERDATPEMVDLLFTSRKFRREAVHRMRNASVTRLLSADPQFFPRYEIRFRNYERVKKEVTEVRQLLQSGESGISPSREVHEFLIAQRGDAVLEFANIGNEASHNDPVLRFRVSSYMLAETSPIFARMFSGPANSMLLHEAEDITPHIPPFPVPYVCKDGSEARLYRMPQHELNRHQSLEILLHAAHMHNELIPREVSFDQFVAIADCSMRYKSTSPLEMVVEHRWLPQWMHRGADDMPDGVLVISYAFGCRQLFTRMSKSAILNLVDEKDLQSKPWPQKIKDKIWAVRCAKLAQIYSCCTNAIQEHIRQPNRDSPRETCAHPQAEAVTSLQTATAAPPAYAATLTSPPRCPKGSHSCDASNLGWMMLVFNQMSLLPQILQPSVLSHMPESEESRSLAQLVETLRMMPSPASPVHRGGVCDPSPAFRAAIADIYNSVTGLTLHDISGKSHGWALSKHRMLDPQTIPATGLSRMAASNDNYSVVNEFSDSIRFQILLEIGDLSDLHAAARINKGFYETYQTHELTLMRNILRADRLRTGFAMVPQRAGNSEDKIPKEVSDMIKREGPIEGADAITIGTDDYDYSDEDDEDDLEVMEGTEAPPRNTALSSPPLTIDPPGYTDDERRSSEDAASPTTPRQITLGSPAQSQPSPRKPDETVTVVIEEPLMTDEEAHRILWPDPIVSESPTPINPSSPGVEVMHEKFRVGDPSFVVALEDKTLVITGDKQLRSELDRKIGLSKKGQDIRPNSSGNASGGCGSKS